MIEQEVEKVLQVINKEQFKDIEELSQVGVYLENMPKVQLQNIRSHIQDAMSKMTLLEDYECKL